MRKILKSFFSIIIGLFIAGIILLLIGRNPFMFYSTIFTAPFSSTRLFLISIMYFSILLIAAIACGISFKGGLFNIGIPGQMLAGAMVSVIFALTIFPNGAPYAWIIFIPLSMLSGGAIGAICGWLKARFKIHEVLSTIMTNWIIFYIGKWIFGIDTLKHAILPGSKILNKSLHTPLIIIILFAVLAVTFMYILIYKTTIGYKIRAVGNNIDAAHYAGINQKQVIIKTLAISGALAGLTGMFYYTTYLGYYTIPLFAGFDKIGFDGLITSLLAFHNPFGIIWITLFMTILKIGADVVSVGNPGSREIISIITGIVLYFVAISIIFDLVKTKWKKIKLTKSKKGGK